MNIKQVYFGRPSQVRTRQTSMGAAPQLVGGVWQMFAGEQRSAIITIANPSAIPIEAHATAAWMDTLADAPGISSYSDLVSAVGISPGRFVKTEAGIGQSITVAPGGSGTLTILFTPPANSDYVNKTFRFYFPVASATQAVTQLATSPYAVSLIVPSFSITGVSFGNRG